MQRCADPSPIFFGDLLAAICRDPGDDAPRLVYADACADERGELIVAQCALAAGDDREALVRRDIELLAMHGERWFAALEPFNEIVVHRGFVQQLAVYVRDLRVSEVFAREPVEHLSLDRNPEETFSSGPTTAQLMCALMRPEVARVRILDLPERIGRDGLLVVAHAARLSKLRGLRIRAPWIDDADFGYFVRGSMLESLEALVVDNADLTVTTPLRGSLARLRFPRLRRLGLREQSLASATVLGLANSDAYERLEEIDLFDNPALGAEVIGPLLGNGRLRSLGLGRTRFAAAHAVQLATAPQVARLVQLDLSDTAVESYLGVLAAAYIPALRDLDLGAGRASPPRRPSFGELRPLYDAPWFTQLETLRLDGRAIGDRGLARLLARPLPTLRTLTLANCDLTMEALATLVAAGLPALEVLDLGDNDQIGPGAIDVLARAPWFPQLRSLRIALPSEAPPMRVREIRDAGPHPRIRARSLAPPLWPARSLLGLFST